MSRAFTLTELMVAVLVLIGVIVATSKIFGTASQVTGLGQAASSVLQDTAAIERKIRADIENLSPDGFFAIRCVAVRNDVHATAGRGPVNPVLPSDAWVRADQLLFFTHGAQSIQTASTGAVRIMAQGTASRVYYGHGVQIPQGLPTDTSGGSPMTHDDDYNLANPLVPWHAGRYAMVRTPFPSGSETDHTPVASGLYEATQPAANRWILTRQALVLADDGDHIVSAAGTYIDPNRARFRNHHAALDIWRNTVLNGRVDVAGSELDEIRRFVLDWNPPPNGDGVPDNWLLQQETMSAAVVYPRAERLAPGMHRLDQALSAHVLAGVCSSFIVDWTYDDGVGFAESLAGTYNGAVAYSGLEQPWFGLDRAGDATVSRGVQPFEDYVLDLPAADRSDTIDPAAIEELSPMLDTAASLGVENRGAFVYSAVFGYNQDRPLDPATGAPWPANSPNTYTPRPSAIRITMVLHDTDNRLEVGREIQFVIRLPERDPR